LITLSYYGAEKVVDHYNVMGPVKATLEASVRYLAHELGPMGIRVNAISPGAIKTRAASGIKHFDELQAPLRRVVDACEVGRVSVLLASDYGASITGEIIHADAGYHVAGMIFH
jgi:enoyl-[acyl-carrier protein] reductase I